MFIPAKILYLYLALMKHQLQGISLSTQGEIMKVNLNIECLKMDVFEHSLHLTAALEVGFF